MNLAGEVNFFAIWQRVPGRCIFDVSLGRYGACPSILGGVRISRIIDPGCIDFRRDAHWRYGIIIFVGRALRLPFSSNHGKRSACPTTANKKLRFIKQKHAEIAWPDSSLPSAALPASGSRGLR
jgi:hypothetical protein